MVLLVRNTNARQQQGDSFQRHTYPEFSWSFGRVRSVSDNGGQLKERYHANKEDDNRR